MIVRAYDRANKEYFISEVYAKINYGYYEKYLVLQKTKSVQGYRLIEWINKSSEPGKREINIEIISTNDFTMPWIGRSEDKLHKYNSLLNPNNKNDSFFNFSGYEFVLDNDDYILELLKGNVLPINVWEKYSIDTRLKDWNYVVNKEDIYYLMSTYGGFHGALLRSLNYVSGAGKAEYVDMYMTDATRMVSLLEGSSTIKTSDSTIEDNSGRYLTDAIRQVSMIFDKTWSDSIEMVFEGVLKLNLCPAKDNGGYDIYGAFLEQEDEVIKFYTNNKELLREFDFTWIESLGLRWRFI